jgi:hypothetical protein
MTHSEVPPTFLLACLLLLLLLHSIGRLHVASNIDAESRLHGAACFCI